MDEDVIRAWHNANLRALAPPGTRVREEVTTGPVVVVIAREASMGSPLIRLDVQ